MTALTGVSSGLMSMVAIGVLLGPGKTPSSAAASKAISAWFPPKQVSRQSEPARCILMLTPP